MKYANQVPTGIAVRTVSETCSMNARRWDSARRRRRAARAKSARDAAAERAPFSSPCFLLESFRARVSRVFRLRSQSIRTHALTPTVARRAMTSAIAARHRWSRNETESPPSAIASPPFVFFSASAVTESARKKNASQKDSFGNAAARTLTAPPLSASAASRAANRFLSRAERSRRSSFPSDMAERFVWRSV